MLEKSKLFAESWNVAYRKKVQGGIIKDTATPFIVVRNSYRYWAADPFVFDYEGKTYIFAELYDYISRRGVIGYTVLENGKCTHWKKVIEENYHLSFPYICQSNGEIYIIPESNKSNTLYAYRATRFPDVWEKACIIRENVRLVDTVFFINHGRTMALSYNISSPNAPQLVLLDIENSKMDKVVSVTHAELRRPAGKININEGIRVAQNCTTEYGEGLIFYSFYVEDNVYTEREIKRISPENISLSKKMYINGLHTYNTGNKYEVIDVKTRRLNLIDFIMRLANKIKKVI